ncbi:MAG: preprotein translocase subunit YajC [Gammaproteobacteria bacterium]|jgi:preprotein translocase subunit YajC
MLSFLISDAMAEAPAAAGGEAGWTGLLFPFVLLAIFYFFLIRPQIKRQKEHKSLVDSIQKGDEVQTEGGLLGRVTDLGDDYMKVEISDGVEIKMRRGSVAAVLPKGTLKDI